MGLLTPHSTDVPARPKETYPEIVNISGKIKRLLYAALLIGTAALPGCTAQQKAKEPQPVTRKTYNYTNPGKIRIVIRKTNFCTPIKDNLKHEESRCTNNKRITKKNGVYCLECDTTTEVVDYN